MFKYKPEFEELAYHLTPLGELILRRRTLPSLKNTEVYEVKLDGAFLMSSLNNVTEIALAELPLGKLGEGPYDVLIGGLGLGYTAKAALDCVNVGKVTVIEYLPQVIHWHHRGLVPLGNWLTAEPRCTIVQADFFEWALSENDPAHESIPRRFGAILVDIDHSPEYLLQPANMRFYQADSLQRLAGKLVPGGVFALWSADPPQDSLVRKMETAFAEVTTHEIEFYDTLFSERDANTIYLAHAPEVA